MTLRLDKIAFLIYVSFAFDSLLKVSYGIQLHLGILAIISINIILLLLRPRELLHPIYGAPFFLVFILFFLSSALVYQHPGSLLLSVYLLVALNVMVYCFYTERYIDDRSFYYFHVVLIATGFIQYFYFKLFNMQISFIGADHYLKGSSVSLRLRGFFVEPNWFSIAMTFNSFLLVGKDLKGFVLDNKVLSILTAVVFLLNGSLATLIIFVLVYGVAYSKRSVLKFLISLVLVPAILIGALSYRAIIKNDLNVLSGSDTGQVLNHFSRVEPLKRVVEYKKGEDIGEILLGQGISSWGPLAVPERLSVLVFENKPGVRDGSEIPVIFFEMGLVGIILLLLDLFYTFMKCDRSKIHLQGAMFLFFVCLFLYPVFKFWMYMPYYFYVRAMVYKNESV